MLIPIIGPQAKFKKFLADWKEALQLKEGDVNNVKEVEENDEIKKIIEVYGRDIEGLTPTKSSPILSPVSTPTSTKSSISSLDLPSRTNSVSISSSKLG